jgi:ribosomal protein S27E
VFVGLFGELCLAESSLRLLYPLFLNFYIREPFDTLLLWQDIRCAGCANITTVFSHAQTVVVCSGCTQVLCTPSGGKAKLSEGTHNHICVAILQPSSHIVYFLSLTFFFCYQVALSARRSTKQLSLCRASE